MTWVKVKLALEELPSGDRLEVLLSGEEPLRNVPKNAAEEGHRVLSTTEAGGGKFKLVIEAVHPRGA